MAKQAYPAHPTVPISKAIRAGDFVFTSAYGPWTFDPKKVVFDADGNILDDGSGHKDVPFDEQVHLTFGFIRGGARRRRMHARRRRGLPGVVRRRARFRALQRDLPDLLHARIHRSGRCFRSSSCSTEDRAQGHRLQAARKRLTMRAESIRSSRLRASRFAAIPPSSCRSKETVPDRVLQEVAAQLNEPVLASLRPTAEGRAELLFHTPTGRHIGAGHSMMAAAHVELRRDGRRPRQGRPHTRQTRANASSRARGHASRCRGR